MKHPPPKNFHPIRQANLISVELSPNGPSLPSPPRRSPGALAGLRHERKILTSFARQHPDAFIPQPWLQYRLRSSPHRTLWAQPDGLLIFLAEGRIIILEIKLRHTIDAWYQLRMKYEPLIRHLFSPNGEPWLFSCCEVVRWHDPSLRFPEHLHYVAEPSMLAPGEFGLHIRER